MWELCRRPSPCSFSTPDCHRDCRLLCRVTALGFVGFGGTQWDEGKGESRLGWSLAAPPSCASASQFTRLGSSPSSCFLRLQTILGKEATLWWQKLHHGGNHYVGAGNPVSGERRLRECPGLPERERQWERRKVSSKLGAEVMSTGLGRQVYTAPPRPG